MTCFLRLLFVLIGAASVLVACAGPPIGHNASDRGTVVVDIQSNARVNIIWARTYAGEDGLVVWGRVRNPGRSGFNAIPGHIHAEISTASDSFVAGVDIPPRLLNINKPWETGREARFSSEIPMPVGGPEGFIVHLKYHVETI